MEVFAIEEAKRKLAEANMTKVEPIPCVLNCGELVQPRIMDRHIECFCAMRLKRLLPPSVTFGVAVKARCVDMIDFSMRGKLPPVTFAVDA